MKQRIKNIKLFCNNKSNSLFYISTITFIGTLGIVLFLYSIFKYYSSNEINYMQTSWNIFCNQKIYIDFFEHHHPLFFYILTPILYIFGANTISITIARLLMFVFLILIGIISYKIAKLTFNKKIALLTPIMLYSFPNFCERAIEIRPQLPQTLFSLLAFLFLFYYLKQKKVSDLIISAICITIAFFFLQSTGLIMVLIGLILIYNFFKKNISFYPLIIYAGTFIIIYGTYLLYYFINGTFSTYFICNFLLNSSLYDKSLYETVRTTFKEFYLLYQANRIYWLFYIIGGICFLKNKNGKLIFFVSVILYLLLFLSPYSETRSIMLSFPFLSIITANGIYSVFYNKTGSLIIVLCFTTLPPIGSFYIKQIYKKSNLKWYKETQLNLATSTKNNPTPFSKNLRYFCSYGEIINPETYDGNFIISNHVWLKLIEKHKPQIISSKMFKAIPTNSPIKSSYIQNSKNKTTYIYMRK